MSMHFRQLAEQAAADGAITAEEILALRRAAWPDGTIDPEEADAILALNDLVAERTPEWADFLVEAIGEFVVNGTQPRGYVDEATADWLIARIDHDARLDSMAELELLVRVLEKAQGAPERLRTYALVQIERAVVFGTGPTRAGGNLDAGCITAGECTLIRRVIFASGGDGPARVSKGEAEMLFRIKDATLGADNAPEWQKLFVQGVGNYLQAWHGAASLTRERAGELEMFMNDRTSRVGQFFTRMARTDGTKLIGALGFGRKGLPRDVAAEAAAEHAVTRPEMLWLDMMIAADDQVDPLETALLAFLQEG